nr:hypothetical protein [Asanoa siamensis]
MLLVEQAVGEVAKRMGGAGVELRAGDADGQRVTGARDDDVVRRLGLGLDPVEADVPGEDGQAGRRIDDVQREVVVRAQLRERVPAGDQGERPRAGQEVAHLRRAAGVVEHHHELPPGQLRPHVEAGERMPAPEPDGGIGVARHRPVVALVHRPVGPARQGVELQEVELVAGEHEPVRARPADQPRRLVTGRSAGAAGPRRRRGCCRRPTPEVRRSRCR